MHWFNRILVVTAAVTLVACTTVSVEDYAGNQPTLVPETFFDGSLTAHGVVKNRSGKVLLGFILDVMAY